jgi:hypothetical protein
MAATLCARRHAVIAALPPPGASEIRGDRAACAFRLGQRRQRRDDLVGAAFGDRALEQAGRGGRCQVGKDTQPDCETRNSALEVCAGVAAATVIRCGPFDTVAEFQKIVYGGPDVKYLSSTKTNTLLTF